MRLIDADNLLIEMEAGCIPIHEKGISGITGDESCIKDYIDNAPTVDAEPVKYGKWLIDEDRVLQPNKDGTFSVGNTYTCFECNWKCSCEDKLNFSYCPNCGAKMECKENECEQA